MRFSLPLYLFKLPKGHIHRGKYRLVKRVTTNDVNNLKKDYEREEENMFFLRHPYLTAEQSNYLKNSNKYEMKRIAIKNIIEKSQSEAIKKFSKHRTLKDELLHLKVAEKWEFKAGSET